MERLLTPMLFAALLLVGGCAGSPTDFDSSRGGEPIQMDRLHYDARHVSATGAYRQYEFRVVSRFTNGATPPVCPIFCS